MAATTMMAFAMSATAMMAFAVSAAFVFGDHLALPPATMPR